jgi:hypothetical protein
MCVQDSGKKGSMIYKVLEVLFEGDIRPARELFHTPKGPRCISHMAWGNGVKPLYLDSLLALRASVYKVLQYAIRGSVQFPPLPAKNFFVNEPRSKSRRPSPKIVLVTRRHSSTNNRKVSSKTEDNIVQLFRDRGYLAEVCCDFSVSWGTSRCVLNYQSMRMYSCMLQAVNTISLALAHFAHADICMGAHGAGLANCVFANPNAVVFEFQNWHNYGFDSFAKVM